MLVVHQAHRVDALVQALARRLGTDPLGPLEREVVVVESRGLARRLPLELTRHLGVSAGLHLPMPAAFIWESLLLPFAGKDLEKPSPWGKEALTWRIADLLKGDPSLAGPGEALLRKADGPRVARELGQRLADLFDQYLVFRPGMLLAWQEEPHADLPGSLLAADAASKAPWQRLLWLKLRQEQAMPTRADLMSRWLRLAVESDVGALPRRISFFNLRGLPPAQLMLLERLSSWRQVDFYLANPSPEYYWSDLSFRERRKQPVKLDEAPLVQANGLELGQWIDQLLGAGAQFESPLDALPQPGDTLLGRLQHSLSTLGPMPAAPLDSSLQLHACHSLQRQAEVLHDGLLDLFQRNPDLGPGDVLVLCADMDTARPALEAVFSTQEEGRQIPWAMARQGRGELRECLSRVLGLVDGRRQVDDVLAPLACAPLGRKLGLEAADLPLLEDWCRSAGIVWGLDGEHRARLDLPATKEHSWRAGLDRLVLGYAMEECEESAYLPVEAVAGRHGVLEALLAWHHQLEGLRGEIQEAREPARWVAWLLDLLPRLMEPFADAERRELDALRQGLCALAHSVEAAGPCDKIPWPVALDALREALQQEEGAIGGLDGRLTLLPMLAGRGVSARVIVLFGLDDQVFPRAARRDELDLCLAWPLPGDRQARVQDRGQFLDAVCAAQEALLVFWQGMDAREGRLRPSSVVVGELLAWLQWSLRKDGDTRDLHRPAKNTASGVAPRQHPMQGFSWKAYASPEQASFHQGRHGMANALARARLGAWRTTGPRLWETTLETAMDPPREVELAQVLDFFRNPARAFLRQAGVRLPWEGKPLPRHEPFTVDALSRGALRRRLFLARLEGQEETRVEARLRAEGLLPWGSTGSLQMRRLWQEVEQVVVAAARLCGGAPQRTKVLIPLDGLQLKGEILQRGGIQILPMIGSTTSLQVLPGWIQHLAWQLALPEDEATPCQTVVITLDNGAVKERVLPVTGDAAIRLRSVLALWREGQTRWVPWFQRASEEMAEAEDEALDARDFLASREWFKGREYLLEDRWVQLVLEGTDPMGDALLASRVVEVARRLGSLLPDGKASTRGGAA